MKIEQIVRLMAFVVLLPVAGIAFAAAGTRQDDSDNQTADPSAATESADSTLGVEEIGQQEPALDGATVDGRQDSESRANSVWLDESNSIRGQVSTIGVDAEPAGVSELPISLYSKGAIVAQTITDETGQFEFTGVSPGVYSLIGRSESALVSFGFYAFPHDPTIEAATGDEWFDGQLDVLAIPGDDLSIVESLMRLYLPGISLGENTSPAELFAKATRQDYQLPAITEPMVIEDVAELIGVERVHSTSVRHHPVLAQDGRLVGELSQIFGSPIVFGSMRVHLVKDTVVAYEAGVDPTGAFEFENVEPGTYGFVAAGSGGFAALSIEVSDEPDVDSAQLHQDGFQFVSSTPAVNRRAVSTLSVALIAQQDVPGVDPDQSIANDDIGGAFAGLPAGNTGPPAIGGGGGGGAIGGGALPLFLLPALPFLFEDSGGGSGPFFLQASPGG